MDHLQDFKKVTLLKVEVSVTKHQEEQGLQYTLDSFLSAARLPSLKGVDYIPHRSTTSILKPTATNAKPMIKSKINNKIYQPLSLHQKPSAFMQIIFI